MLRKPGWEASGDAPEDFDRKDTMSSIQVKVALRKEAKPELYCPWPKCLWETGDGSLCPRHGNGARAQRDPHMQEIGRSYEKGAP